MTSHMIAICAALMGVGGTVTVQKAAPKVRLYHPASAPKVRARPAPHTAPAPAAAAVPCTSSGLGGFSGSLPIATAAPDLQSLIQPSPSFTSIEPVMSSNPVIYTQDVSGGGGSFVIPAPPPPASSAPEPSAWALMVIGFGAIGAALRMRMLRRA